MRFTRRQFGVGMFGLAASMASRAHGQQSPAWTTGKIAVPGGNVLWRAHGKGRKVPLLLVHGGPSGADSKPFETMSALGDERQLLTWDQLDCGESDHPNDPANWRLARYVEEMDVVRRELAPGPVHVMGGSWGSMLAMEWLVAKRPRDVVSVIFICPTLDYARAEASRRTAQTQLSAPSKAAFDDLARTSNFANPALLAANQEYQRTFIIRHPPAGMTAPRVNPAMMRALTIDVRAWSRVADIGKLTQPLLFIRGEHDYVTAEDVDVYAKASPRSQTATIPDAAHIAFVDNPDATIHAVRRFLNTVDR